MTDDAAAQNSQQIATNEAKPTVEGRVSPRLAKAIHLILTGECKSQKAAAKRMGFNESYLSEALRKPHVQVFIARRSRETIAAGTMRASARLMQLLDAGSEHVSLDAAKHTLGIAGIKPTADAAVNVNIDIKAGYVIDLTEDKPARAMTIDVSPARPAVPASAQRFEGPDPTIFKPPRRW